MENKSNWELIKESNDLIQPILFKGKEYVEVKERVIAFRRVHPLGQIITELSFTTNYVNCEASIYDEKNVLLAKGHSRELLNTQYAFEKAETSAIGRALGFCGFGISTSIASAEDMENVDKPSEIFDERPINEVINDLQQRLTKQELVDLSNAFHIINLNQLPVWFLEGIIKFKNEND